MDLAELAQSRYVIPLIIFGHSMAISFFATQIKALAASGTSEAAFMIENTFWATGAARKLCGFVYIACPIYVFVLLDMTNALISLAAVFALGFVITIWLKSQRNVAATARQLFFGAVTAPLNYILAGYFLVTR